MSKCWIDDIFCDYLWFLFIHKFTSHSNFLMILEEPFMWYKQIVSRCFAVSNFLLTLCFPFTQIPNVCHLNMVQQQQLVSMILSIKKKLVILWNKEWWNKVTCRCVSSFKLVIFLKYIHSYYNFFEIYSFKVEFCCQNWDTVCTAIHHQHQSTTAPPSTAW